MRSAIAVALLAWSLVACSPSDSPAQPPPSRWDAHIVQADAAMRRGERQEANRMANVIVAEYARGGTFTSADRVVAGRAYVILSAGDASAARAALAAFDAANADGQNLEATRRTGDLFLEKYNAPDARLSFESVLTRDPDNADALFGLAQVEEFEGKPTALATVRRALAANPRHIGALVFVARTFLEAEQWDSATVSARRALNADTASVPAWTVLGAMAWLRGDSATYRSTLATVRTLQPQPSEFFAQLAESAVRQRRYAEAVQLAEQAVAYDNQSVRALGVLGTNQLRTSRMTEGQATLDRAFALDPFNVWHKNTLDLLDKLKTFRTIKQGRFELVAPTEEAELLALYALPLLEQAFDSLSTRYGYAPPTPVRLEFYRQHADFSVRSVGLVGLGALGVSFGSLLAMDTPSARDRGSFNWGSTAWHELAHAFTLGASAHRTPRWLSEGLSVLEERRARQGWGADASVPFVAALNAGLLRPMSQLSEGFVRPRFPDEIQFSYYQASLFCEMVESVKGAQALPAMLVAYRDGDDTPAVFQRVLGWTPAQVDQQFDRWMRTRFAVPLINIIGDRKAIAQANDDGGTSRDSARSGPRAGLPAMVVASGPFIDAMKRGMADMQSGNRDAARVAFEQASALFPGYAGDDSPAWFLARLAVERGDSVAALRYVGVVTARNETAWEANLLEANLREAALDLPGASAALERLQWMSPYDNELHARLATVATARRDHTTALRERRAVVANQPADLLTARYELARALANAGDVAAARREVLQVLEQAPAFEKAQSLLLELRGRSNNNDGENNNSKSPLAASTP